MENNQYRSPESQLENHETQVPRGGCLSTFLVLMIVANTMTVISYLAMPEMVKFVSPEADRSWGYALAAGGVLNVIFALMVWFWRKVGVYGFLAVSIGAFAVNIHLGMPWISSIIGLIGPILLLALVSPKWSRFE